MNIVFTLPDGSEFKTPALTGDEWADTLDGIKLELNDKKVSYSEVAFTSIEYGERIILHDDLEYAIRNLEIPQDPAESRRFLSEVLYPALYRISWGLIKPVFKDTWGSYKMREFYSDMDAEEDIAYDILIVNSLEFHDDI